MGRIIAITNQKGGVGKTTTSINLASCLAEAGKTVLLIDIDPQGNSTSGVGIDKNHLDTTIYDMIIGECQIEECIIKTDIEKLFLLPSNVNLSGAEIDLIGIEDREYILKKSVDSIKSKYDYMIIDCPPSLSMLTVNALTAADTVLVPTGNLDEDNEKIVLDILKGLSEEGKTVIIVSHSSAVKKYADKVLNIRDGVLEE